MAAGARIGQAPMIHRPKIFNEPRTGESRSSSIGSNFFFSSSICFSYEALAALIALSLTFSTSPA